MNKTLLATLVLGLVASTASAETAATYFSFLSPQDRQALMAKGELTRVSDGISRDWADRAPFASLVYDGLSVPKPTVSAEGFFLVPRPAGATDLAVYNAVNAVAAMEGMEYYSVTRNRMEPLVLASWRVASASNPTKQPDPGFMAIPGFQKAVIYQKDNKVGDGLSEVTWRSTPSGLVMTTKNLDPLMFGFLTLVDPGNLQMLFVVVPLEGQMAVYGIMEAKTAQLFGLERSKDESFRNRMRALAAWLGKQITALK